MAIAFDSMVCAALFQEEFPVSLKSVASLILGVDDWGKGTFAFGDDPRHPVSPLWGVDGMGTYCAKDTAYSHLLYLHQRERLQADQELAKLLKFLILPGLEGIVQMEVNGIWVDRARVVDQRRLLCDERDALHDRILQFIPEDFRARASIHNEHFLRRWFFGHPPDGLGLEPISFTPRGKAQVNDHTLSLLQHPVVDLIRQYKAQVKLLQFLDGWEKYYDPDDRMHPHWNPTGTVTGRRSCDRPNLQQIPRNKSIRSCLGAPAGWKFFECDFSMIEVRIAAWFAEEETMLAIFAQGSGDVYRYTAAVIYGKPEAEVTKQERQGAKAVVLGLIYGLGARKLGIYAKDTFGVEFTPAECVQFRDTFFRTYPAFVKWHERQRRIVRKQYHVRSPLGRIRHIMRILSTDKFERGRAERMSINSPVQGCGADFTLACIGSLDPFLDPSEILLVGDIHDALLFQIREEVWEKWVYVILRIMENPPIIKKFDLTIPVRMKAEGKIGTRWGEGKVVVLEDFITQGKLRPDWYDDN